jgi:TonB-dependent SusC/RagA subfamily outer membrane receptor
METFLIYALKHLVLTGLFLAAYKFWLYSRKQFAYNRFFLLFGLLASLVVPLIEIKKIVWVQWVPPMNEATEYVILANNGQPFISLLDWIGIGLLTGSALVLIQLLFRAAIIYKIINKSEIVQRKKPKLLVSNIAKAPFSFLQQIVFPKELYLGPNYEVILDHEKIHVKQGHSFDVLLVHLFLVFGWWNPLLWVYKKAIIENLEFLTDYLTVSKTKESKAYQYILLQQTVPQQQLVLAHPFYHSFLKKRIMMLNANTPKKSPWASLILVPMMVGFVLLFNNKIVAQIAPPPPPIPASVIPPPPPPRLASDTLVVGQLSSLIPPPPPMVSEMSIALSIEAASSEESLNREISFFKEYGISLSFNKIKRNAKGLITGIKAAFKSEAGTSGVYAVSGDMPISNFEFFAELDGDEKLVNAGFRAKADEVIKHIKALKMLKTVEIKEKKHEKQKDKKVMKITIDKIAYQEKDSVEFVFFNKDTNKKSFVFINGKSFVGDTLAFEYEKLKDIDFDLVLPDSIAHSLGGLKAGKNGLFVINTENENHKTELKIKKPRTPWENKENQPLYIIDGKEQPTGKNINDIKPNDIESISVLKGEAAVKTYGKKGVHGVIIITSKKEK